ncbi:hypothetical protein AB1046_18340 [Promicromonospora sp. Populi]|uniref:hypothetical protein n=1 Tax=Promicromonospora sp. Populi TaxID=3239420 RepID=UPI0034E25232
MNRTDPNEGWDDESNFLSGALHGAADEMPGAEVDDLHISFGVVRDRVRRRRAAKISGVTGASLVVVGVLALGATQIPLLDRNSALPGVSGDVEAYASVGPEAAPSPSGPPATSVIQDGYQPSWLEWSDLTCGMPVADLETTAAGWAVASAGDIYATVSDFGGDPSTSWGMAATVQEGEGALGVAPVLVWSQDGVVVDLGSNVFGAPGPQSEPLIGGDEGSAGTTVAATGNSLTTCAPTETETDPIFETTLPEGDYEVRVVAYPEVASGQRATAVSEPVAVRLDAVGAHSPTLMRGGFATIEPSPVEPPAPIDGEQSRFVLDRTTDWVTAELTRSDYNSTDPVQVISACESADEGDTVPFEVVVPSTQAVLSSGFVSCDGAQTVETFGVLDGGGEVLDIRLGAVPDGVERLWAVLAPDGSTAVGDAAGECSANDVPLEYDPANSPNEGAGATARAIVEAAQACDNGALVGLATMYPTELLIPAEPADEVFLLPEGDVHYRTLVALLAGTVGADQGNGTIVWPRVVTEEFRDSDEAWDEVVAAGLLTQEEADAQRADEVFGYTGMQIAIDTLGNWRYYSATP